LAQFRASGLRISTWDICLDVFGEVAPEDGEDYPGDGFQGEDKAYVDVPLPKLEDVERVEGKMSSMRRCVPQP